MEPRVAFIQFLLEKSAIDQRQETFSAPVTWFCVVSSKWRRDAEPAMNSRITNDSEQIDRKTCRSICDAIGERLQQSLRPDTSRLSSHLQHLMDELRKRDSVGRWRSSN
jgi:hypothetical protein